MTFVVYFYTILVMSEELIEQLTSLGLNRLEANVYIDLLQHQASTGYAIGKRLGKATANVYKAIDALAAIGAVQIEEGDTARLCRAVSPTELIAQLEHSFQAKKQGLLESLTKLEQEDEKDERIYRVDSVSLLLEKARTMLAKCEAIAVIDGFPQVLEILQPDIETAVNRGIQVIIQAYAPFSMPNATITIIPDAEGNLVTWQSEQLNIIIDANETLLALMSCDLQEVYQSIWSQSVYLAFILHVGLIRENDAHTLLQMENSPSYFVETQNLFALDTQFIPSHVPGLQEIFSRYGLGVPEI